MATQGLGVYYLPIQLIYRTDITTGEASFIPEYDGDGKSPDGSKGDWTNREARLPRRGEPPMGRRRINQTRIKTSTGTWTAAYNAQNRPTHFTRENADGTRTVITAAYDYMGRRAWKKVETIATDPETGEETATVTLHQRYIYRGYLQVAACDLTRGGHPCLWLITWDPTQPMATRPLAIQKDGTWCCYGWDLTKNIGEAFDPAGYVRTTYAYSLCGIVTEEGNVAQPLQWSSEYADAELGLVYYNYRSYNPTDGRQTSRDILGEVASILLYAYTGNMVEGVRDILGLIIQRQPSLGKLIFEPIPGGQEPECQACAKRMHEMKTAMHSRFRPIPGTVCRVQVKCDAPEGRYRHASALGSSVSQPPPKSHKSDIERVVMTLP